MKKILCLILAAIFSLSLFACTASESADDGKLDVLATVFPQYDFARAVAGDRANVQMLLPPGADSHSFDPSMKDAEKIGKADIFIYTGDAMENWALHFANNARSDCLILDLSEKIDLITAAGDSHDHGINVDPHFWTSPKNAVVMLDDILAAMCEKDPENAEYYRSNADTYRKQLKSLDEEITKCVENGTKSKIYFGGEFALRYFTEHYGIEYMTLYDSCSEWSEPDSKAVGAMISEMKANGISVIFYPELCDPKAARSIAAETGADLRLFHSCHNLSQDELDAGKTYVSIMAENLSSLKEALS